jgi:transposase
MRKKRRHFSGEEKVAILRRHLLEKVTVSELCDEYGLQPTVFYRWQQQFFENGGAVFEREDNSALKAAERKISVLEAKLVQKNEVVSELMEEHVKLKKELGEPW